MAQKDHLEDWAVFSGRFFNGRHLVRHFAEAQSPLGGSSIRANQQDFCEK
jgi:hypothetical protein